MRSATNLILVAMAQSDMLTGLWPLPCYVYFYTLERAAEYVPYAWCFVYHCLTEYLPTICHTASIWLTVALAVHRCVLRLTPGFHPSVAVLPLPFRRCRWENSVRIP